MNETVKLKPTHTILGKSIGMFLFISFFIALVLSVIEIALASAHDFYSGNITVFADTYFYTLARYGDLSYAVAEDLFNLVYSMRYYAVLLAVSSFTGAAFSLVFICCAAGHSGETDEIFLNFVDKIPLEIVAIAHLAAAILFAAFSTVFPNQLELLFISAFFLLFILLCISLFMTCVTRIKANTLIKNTLVYITIKFTIKHGKTIIIKSINLALNIIKWLFKTSINILKYIFSKIKSIFLTIKLKSSALRQNIKTKPWTFLVIIVLISIEVILSVINFSSGEFFPFIFWFAYNIFLITAFMYGAQQISILQTGIGKLVDGNFEEKVDTTKMYWEFSRHGDMINSVADGIAIVVEEKMKSERLKAELITNVSHDIKTPLTSIINYVDLLQRDNSDEENKEYLEVLSRQSRKLKKLTEDLVEASKASTGNINVNLQVTCLNELLEQASGEHTEKLASVKLKLVKNFPNEKIYIMADGNLLWRVIDNLFSNIYKYSLADTRVYLNLLYDKDRAYFNIKNISKTELNFNADDLSERFVRGDSSRSTEGSGLGLNIAKSLTELQNGKFSISCDADLFKVDISFPINFQ